MKPIGKIYTPLPEKFGAPRQSGLVEELEGKIILDSPYNVKEAFDGIEEFSHLWILWQFSDSIRDEFSPTVRPPRLGGEKRKGVFATRSPFRPNNIGLSCVKLIKVEQTKEHGTVLTVGGVDMKSGTPIYDIKPYIKYADCRLEAKSSFADVHEADRLEIEISDNLKSFIPSDKIDALTGVLSCDPRPAYQNDSNRIYGISFDNMNVKFKVDGDKLTVLEIEK
ncbi:MAG TPA: tRNA (N6-threonylcarbamoyladenosine(37)-N6)-methyltransferase TrmO [Ruminococcaceae bacterium]|jgi:tRNA-Thr(GGU) m(6)t(6)A37 methyltransferase TsaA|nr:tRNA (N6-threonylcarbamoyladenosine(37)-N6)-methyltransferase TrmO [Oscillospiraceae bacterium]